MGRLSGNNVGRSMAIILDGKLMSAPTLQEQITSNGQISGDFKMQEAATIANALLNPLKAPLEIEEEMSVEPCLLYTSPSPRDQRGSRLPSYA